MRFLAIRDDMQPASEVWTHYAHKLSVKCKKCERTYQLWAPLEVSDDKTIQAGGDRLREFLAGGCPEHEEWFYLPETAEA